jgi:predicted cupin superfamily sugar epimerase
VVVRGNVWQGSRLAPGGKWALMGTTMSPGFDYADYENSGREQLIAQYPGAAARIREYTR